MCDCSGLASLIKREFKLEKKDKEKKKRKVIHESSLDQLYER